MAGFTQKTEKLEKSPISIQNTPITPSPTIFEPTNDVTEVYASPTTPNDAIFHPQTLPTCASSSQDLQALPNTGHEKRAYLHAVFESQLPTRSLALTTIISDFKTRSETASFIETHQKLENSPFFTQKPSESLVSGGSNWEDNAESSPAPTTITSALETSSASADFIKNHQKIDQKHPKLPISAHFYLYNGTNSLPTQYISPTKHPCNMSSYLVMFL
jgi:hypothetical protein